MEKEESESVEKRDRSEYYDLFLGLFNSFKMGSTITKDR